MHASMIWVTLAGDSTFFCVGQTLISGFAHDLCLLNLKFPNKERGQPESMKDNEMNDTEGVCAIQSGGKVRFM